MTNKKICPFSMAKVYQYPCIKERCMAWRPEHIEKRLISYDIRATPQPVIIPGYCRLIGPPPHYKIIGESQ